MTPDILLKEIIQRGFSSEKIAESIGCSVDYVNKLRSGARKAPSYVVMDKIRKLHQETTR